MSRDLAADGSSRDGGAPRAVTLSAIVPARNEEALLGETIRALLRAAERVPGAAEVIVVDNASTDRTADVARSFEPTGTVRVIHCAAPGAARARNAGARDARGRVLVFVDGDTRAPVDAFVRVVDHCDRGGFEAGICRLAALDGGWRARVWWAFWNHVRRLPLARAKAMPAFMFCTREAFAEFGPFDERVAIAEEWPILAGLWRARRRRLVYDRTMTAHSSSRRMEMQRFGYARNFVKYVWAVLHFRGRVQYTDRFRGTLAPTAPPDGAA